MPAGLTWRFYRFVYSANSRIANYAERKISQTTVHMGI